MKRYLVAVNVTEYYEVFATNVDEAERNYNNFDMFDRDITELEVEEWAE